MPSTRLIYDFQSLRLPYFFYSLVAQPIFSVVCSRCGTISARSVRLLLTASSTWSDLAVPILFRTPSVPGELLLCVLFDGLFGSGAVYVIFGLSQVDFQQP